MNFSDTIATLVARRLGLTEEAGRQVGGRLGDLWLDTLATLRTATAESLVRAGFEIEVAGAIVAEVADVCRKENGGSQLVKRPTGPKIVDLSQGRGTAARRQSSPSSSRKRTKVSDDCVVEVGLVFNRLVDLRLKVRSSLKHFVGLNIEKRTKKDSLLHLRSLLAKIGDHPEQICSRSIETTRPDNWDQVFQYQQLSQIFDFLRFEVQQQTRIYLNDKNFSRPEIIAVVELVDALLGSLEQVEIEVCAESEEEVIDVSEGSLGVETESRPADREVNAKVDDFLERIQANYKYKLQPEVMFRKQADSSPLPLEAPMHPPNAPLLEAKFDSLKEEFADYEKQLTDRLPSLGSALRRKVKEVSLILGGGRLKITLKVNTREAVEIGLSKAHRLSYVFQLIRKHLIKSDQRFYLFDLLANKRYEPEDGQSTSFLADLWEGREATLSLIMGSKDPHGERLPELSQKCEVIRS